jgi:hypothetical protein
MKRLIIFAGLFFIIGASLTGCYKDVIIPASAVDPDVPPQATSYKTDIAPMLNTKCGLSGCHVAGAQAPFLTTDVSYLALVNGGFVNIAIPKQSILYIMINGEMKEHIPSATDRQKIYDWIRTGALNN